MTFEKPKCPFRTTFRKEDKEGGGERGERRRKWKENNGWVFL